MKIVRINGGLGNQMFQYALFLALKFRFPEEEILVDYSLMKTYNVHNGLELDRVFGVPLPQASFRQLATLTRPVYHAKLARVVDKLLPKRKSEIIEAKDYTYNEEVFSNKSLYYRGYWQNFRYFIDARDYICSQFRFAIPINDKSKAILEELKENNSTVSIHVRRGDYLKSPRYAGLCNLDYYRSAIDKIKSEVNNPTFYLFSDDIEWTMANIVPLLGDLPYKIVDWNRGKESALDMLLMSSCHHNIIANSSFSWWAAFLNTHKDSIVCAPAKWTNTKVNCTFQLPEWNLF